jgi:hypothetical protein
MIEQIANKDILISKARMLKQRNFKPGSDGMSASGAALWIEINAKRLCSEIENGSYEPMPATSFRIAKKSGSFRRISRLTAVDSAIQYAAIDAVNDTCEAVFSPKKTVRVTEAKGLVCASPLVSCPPAVPIVISGEEITDGAIKIFQLYGIETVAVSKIDC